MAPPLWIAKSLSCIPARQRQWLLGRLIYVGKQHGYHEGKTVDTAYGATKPTLVTPATPATPVGPATPVTHVPHITPITPITPITSPLHHLGPALRYPTTHYGLESYA